MKSNIPQLKKNDEVQQKTPQLKIRSDIRSGDCTSCCASKCPPPGRCSCSSDGTSCNCDYYIIK